MGHYFHRVLLLLPVLVAAVSGHPLSGQEAAAAAQQRQQTEPNANVVGTAPDKDLR